MRKEDSLEKPLMLGKCEGKRRRGRQTMRWLDSVIEATNMHLTSPNSRRQWKTRGPGVLWSMGSRRVRHDLTTKQQKNIKITESKTGQGWMKDVEYTETEAEAQKYSALSK